MQIEERRYVNEVGKEVLSKKKPGESTKTKAGALSVFGRYSDHLRLSF